MKLEHDKQGFVSLCSIIYIGLIHSNIDLLVYLIEGERFGTLKVRCSNWALEIYKRYDNENPLHFIHEIKTNGYDVIGGNIFHCMLIRFHRKKG